jgi:hypothetical protein
MSRLFSSKRLGSLSLAAAALFAAIQLATSASAALLVYDPFSIGAAPGDYATGIIGGQNPTESPTNFYNGGWVSAADQDLQTGNLIYPFFPRAGGHVTDLDGGVTCCTTGRSGREIGELDPINAPGELGLGAGRGARTIYQSFLVDFGTAPAGGGNFGKRGVEWWNGYNTANPDGALNVDLFLNGFGGVNVLSLNVDGAGPTVPVVGGGSLADLAGVHLVVMKFELNPLDDLGNSADPSGLLNPLDDDRVTVYLDPTDSIEANWVPGAVATVSDSSLIITHHSAATIFTFDSDYTKSRYDELRWGDTFADVTPFIPEPTSLTLLGISLGSLLMGRRR